MYKDNSKFQISRKIFENELWLYKPAAWIKIWVYILGKVNHTPNDLFDRGEGYFNFAKNIDALGEGVTISKVKSFLVYARRMSILTSRRTTRGTVIKVLKYDENQTYNHCTTTSSTTSEQLQDVDRTSPVSKKVKKVKKVKNVIVAKKFNEDDERLTKLLSDLVAKNYPFLKKHVMAQHDLEEMNKIHRIDKYDYQDIELIIRFSQTDDFWKQNIRSVRKLRKQFETLLVKAQSKIQERKSTNLDLTNL